MTAAARPKARLPRKISLWLLGTLLSLVVVAAALYVAYGHPNDQRIAGSYAPERGAFDYQLERLGSLLQDGMEHALDMDHESFALALHALGVQLPQYATVASPRFVSPYQVYLPVGTYPTRLMARDALYLPAGRTLTVKPALAGDVLLQVALFSPQGEVAVRIRAGAGEAGVVTHPGRRPPTPGRLTQTFDRLVGRYLDVDRVERTEQWQEAQIPLQLTAESALTLTCEASTTTKTAIPGCILGDLLFYKPVATPKHNYLVILVDTLRGDGPTGGHAPTMQGLADEATVFQRALAPGNMTSPSTNAFLSCRRPSQLGGLAFAYGISRERRDAFYRERRPSFAAHFTKAGYDTAMIGNISVISEAYGAGVDHGFAEQIALETEAYETPQTAREVIRWLERRGDRPFLLYAHFNGPHAPYRAPWADLRAVLPPGLGAFRSYPDLLLSLYQAEVHYTDRYLATVLAALDALGLKERTTVVLTADHGDQHEVRPFTGNAAAPDFIGAYFDHGATLLNDEIRVPLMIRRPGIKGQRVDDLVSTLDVGPTLLDLAGLSGKADCAGTSLLPYLNGRGEPAQRQGPDGRGTPAPRVIGSEGFQGRAIVFDNRYKYIRTYESTDKRVYSRGSWEGVKRLYAVPEQLYDLTDDPGERRNLVRDNPRLRERARRLYQDFYVVRTAYELVIDNPSAQPIEAEFATAGVTLIEGLGGLEPIGRGLRFRGQESRRFIFRLGAEAPLAAATNVSQTPAVPRILAAGLPVPVRFSSMRLPVRFDAVPLPLEVGGAGSLPDLARAPEAFLRRIEDDDQSDRRIVAGNAEFEKVLREWGYLNDR